MNAYACLRCYARLPESAGLLLGLRCSECGGELVPVLSAEAAERVLPALQ